LLVLLLLLCYAFVSCNKNKINICITNIPVFFLYARTIINYNINISSPAKYNNNNNNNNNNNILTHPYRHPASPTHDKVKYKYIRYIDKNIYILTPTLIHSCNPSHHFLLTKKKKFLLFFFFSLCLRLHIDTNE
jgi:hypothetical protein